MKKQNRNSMAYVKQWVKDNPRFYQIILSKCKYYYLSREGAKKISIKDVISVVRFFNTDFMFCDQATRHLREYIEIAEPYFDGKFRKIK